MKRAHERVEHEAGVLALMRTFTESALKDIKEAKHYAEHNAMTRTAKRYEKALEALEDALWKINRERYDMDERREEISSLNRSPDPYRLSL